MPTDAKPPIDEQDLRDARAVLKAYADLKAELSGLIVGLDEVVEQVFVTLLCRGHALLEGVPGLAKTLLVSSVAKALGLSFRRIQFTPDLMPADISGTEVLEEDRTTGRRVFRFVPGPVFGNVILADEINRTPPKTQSALLEAMQERQLTVAGATHTLPDPFFVLATQNPIEHEGTYPLPEAQLDRFLMMIRLGYPTLEQELEICRRQTGAEAKPVQALAEPIDWPRLQGVVRRVPVAEHVFRYAVELVRATRPEMRRLPGDLNDMVQWGAGPRAGINLLMAAKARALLHQRFHASTKDVAAVAAPVLRHRIVPTFNAEAVGKSTDQIVRDLLASVPVQAA